MKLWRLRAILTGVSPPRARHGRRAPGFAVRSSGFEPKLQLRRKADQGRLGRVKPELAQPIGQPGSAWLAAVRAGLDVAQLEANLRKSPGERLSAHRRARHMAQQLRRAMENRHARH